MGKLQILSQQMANMIAAGEVVQRPSSVVKELLENAIDAEATQINVIIKDAGRTLIQVIDNGCGMSSEDAELCFARHATSKISHPEDLENIMTFGFRGEALASIAAVSAVTLKTRRAEDETGTMVQLDAGEIKEKKSVNQPIGTSVEVRNLFYNTPARRKFLKSDNVEFKHIVEELTRVAIIRWDLSFTLSHNGRDVLILKKAQSPKYRILDILGTSVVGDVVDLNANTNFVNISGYIGKPESAKKSLGNQFFYVNGRFFKSAYLHKAVMNAYSEVTPDGLTPSYFIFLNVNPQSIDVNISPTKTEVKFENDSIIFQTLYACVRETLGKNGFGDMIDFDALSAVQLPSFNHSTENSFKPSEISAALEFESNYNPFETTSHKLHEVNYIPNYGNGISKSQDYSQLFEPLETKKDAESFIIAKKYICTPVEGGMMLTDIYRAQSRILYERMLSAIKGGDLVKQSILFPIQIQIGPAYIPLIEDNEDALQTLGFGISVFGSDTIVISGVPQGFDLDETSIRNMVADLLQVLEEEKKDLPEKVKMEIAKRLSSLGIPKSGSIKSPLQVKTLLDELFKCNTPETTPYGKRISKLLKVEDLEKLF